VGARIGREEEEEKCRRPLSFFDYDTNAIRLNYWKETQGVSEVRPAGKLY